MEYEELHIKDINVKKIITELMNDNNEFKDFMVEINDMSPQELEKEMRNGKIDFLKEINDNSHIKIDLFYAEPNVDQSGPSVWGSSAELFYGLKTNTKLNFQKDYRWN